MARNLQVREVHAAHLLIIRPLMVTLLWHLIYRNQAIIRMNLAQWALLVMQIRLAAVKLLSSLTPLILQDKAPRFKQMLSLSTLLFKTRSSWRGEVAATSMFTLKTRSIKISSPNNFRLRPKEAMALMAFMEEAAELSYLTVILYRQREISRQLVALLMTRCLIQMAVETVLLALLCTGVTAGLSLAIKISGPSK